MTRRQKAIGFFVALCVLLVGAALTLNIGSVPLTLSTAGGALIGGLAGGGKGALIGSMVGAGGGTTAAYATGKKDVGFGVERRLTFRTTQPVNVKG